MAIAAVADAAEAVVSREGATPPDDQDKVTTGSRERPRQLAVARAEFWCTLLACCLVLLQANLPYLEPLFVWQMVNDPARPPLSGVVQLSAWLWLGQCVWQRRTQYHHCRPAQSSHQSSVTTSEDGSARKGGPSSS